jgi:hypothetical protein
VEILKRGNLVEGGFAGLKEHCLIKDSRLFSSQENNADSWPGLENFVHLTDALVASLFRPANSTSAQGHPRIPRKSIDSGKTVSRGWIIPDFPVK